MFQSVLEGVACRGKGKTNTAAMVAESCDGFSSKGKNLLLEQGEVSEGGRDHAHGIKRGFWIRGGAHDDWRKREGLSTTGGGFADQKKIRQAKLKGKIKRELLILRGKEGLLFF